MRRISIVAVLLLLVAACRSQPVGSPDPAPGPTTGSRAHSTVSGSTVSGSTVSGSTVSGSTVSGSTASGSTVSGSTVSGQIVRGDTGAPYPNAYVRFAWLVNAVYEGETHTVTDDSGWYAIQLPAGQYQVTAGDSCDLNAGFAIVGKAPDDVMIIVPGTSKVDFVEYPITPGADLPGVC